MKDNLIRPIINVYIGQVLEKMPVIFILKKHLVPEYEEEGDLWNLFRRNYYENRYEFLKITDDPEKADFILLPHNYFTLKKILKDSLEDYLKDFVVISKKYDKKIIVLAMADSDEDINIENSLIFRQSQYGYKKKANEIMIPFYTSPAYSEDFIQKRAEIWSGITLRKKSAIPTVSFCGWAGFPSLYRKFTFWINVLMYDAKKYLLRDKYAELHKRGIFFRRKAMYKLKKFGLLKTEFIIRKSYSAQKGLDGLRKITPAEAERQYVHNMINSDFVLCPKGNANGSIRFYEALSMGRLPILINTDCPLPMSDFINYHDFTVNVDYTDIDKIGHKVKDFYDGLSEPEYIRRQQMAREAFQLLKPEALFSRILTTYINEN